MVDTESVGRFFAVKPDVANAAFRTNESGSVRCFWNPRIGKRSGSGLEPSWSFQSGPKPSPCAVGPRRLRIGGMEPCHRYLNQLAYCRYLRGPVRPRQAWLHRSGQWMEGPGRGAVEYNVVPARGVSRSSRFFVFLSYYRWHLLIAPITKQNLHLQRKSRFKMPEVWFHTSDHVLY